MEGQGRNIYDGNESANEIVGFYLFLLAVNPQKAIRNLFFNDKVNWSRQYE